MVFVKFGIWGALIDSWGGWALGWFHQGQVGSLADPKEPWDDQGNALVSALPPLLRIAIHNHQYLKVKEGYTGWLRDVTKMESLTLLQSHLTWSVFWWRHGSEVLDQATQLYFKYDSASQKRLGRLSDGGIPGWCCCGFSLIPATAQLDSEDVLLEHFSRPVLTPSQAEPPRGVSISHVLAVLLNPNRCQDIFPTMAPAPFFGKPMFMQTSISKSLLAGYMYHWKERGKMTFMWATPGGAGTAPPSQMPENRPTTEAESVGFIFSIGSFMFLFGWGWKEYLKFNHLKESH